MKGSLHHINIKTFAPCAIMAILLCWLTVSLPFVYGARQSAAKELTEKNTRASADPMNGAAEEKTPASPLANVNEEYIHHADYDFSFITGLVSDAWVLTHESTYTAYHGELHSPPPNSCV